MRKLLILLLLPLASLGQAPTNSTTQISGSTAFTPTGWRYKDSTQVQMYNTTLGKYFQLVTGKQFNDYIGTATQAAITAGGTVNGWTVSSVPTVGQVVTTGTPQEVFYQLYKQTQVPTASLSGGTTYELGVSDATHSLSWSYGRQAATATISTAVISPGSLSVFGSQPAQPGTVSGTQSVTTPSNTNRTYTLTVTTSDGKTAIATTTDTWLPGRYWGRSASATPDNTIILAVAGGEKQLNGAKANTGFTITSSGSNYVYYAYAASLGDLTSILVGGFESIGAFTKTVVSVTNVNGYTQNYNVYTSNSTFSATTPTIITN